MQINWPENVPVSKGGSLREGNLKAQVLLTGEDGTPNNYRATLETAQDSWSTPAHRHNIDQIRLAIAGKVDYGKAADVQLGAVSYFPESIPYGPQVRHDKSVILTIQLGGASGYGYVSKSDRNRAQEELEIKGRFEKGIFSYNDENGKLHNQDAYEACWEHLRGRKMEYAPPRYSGVVVMKPENFVWVTDPEHPGIARKWLGTFTERQLHISYLHIEDDAELSLKPHPAPQILFVSKGGVSYQGKNYGLHAAFGLEAHEGLSGLAGIESADLLYVQMPIFEEKQQTKSVKKAA